MENTTEISTKPFTLGTNFSEAWVRLKKSFWKLIIASIAFLGIYTAAVAFMTILFMIIGAMYIPVVRDIYKEVGPTQGLAALMRIPSSFWMVFTFMVTVAIVLFTFIAAYFTGLQMLLVSKSSNGAIGKSFHVLPWLFVTSFFLFFVLIGAFGLFIIPGIVVAIFLTFVGYEVVLKQKSLWAGFTGSVHLVRKNFGATIGRVLLFAVIFIAILFLLSYGGIAVKKDLYVLFAIFRTVVNIIVGWYSLAFFVVFYEHIDETTDRNTKTPVWWIFLISILGWLTIGAIIYFAVTFIVPTIKQSIMNKAVVQKKKFDLFTSSQCGISFPASGLADKQGRRWIYEDTPAFNWDAAWGLITKEDAPKGIIGGAMAYKKESERYSSNEKNYKSYPGTIVYCGENPQKLTLDAFVARAMKSGNQQMKVEKSGNKMKWGDLTVQGIYVTGTHNGALYKEPFYIAVSKDGSKLYAFKLWSVDRDDPSYAAFTADQNLILDNLKEQ